MKAEIRAAIDSFLAQKTIALVGYTWGKDDAAWHVFKKLRRLGYSVIPVGTGCSEIDGVPCVPSLAEAPDGVDAVLCTGNASLSHRVMEVCAARGIRYVWLHSALGTSPRRWMRKAEYEISSVGPDAVNLARSKGISLIPGGCPMMFREPVDLPHRLMRAVLERLGCFEERVV